MQACMQRQDSWIPEWDQVCVQLNANIIAEHIYSQVDEDGYGRTLLDKIIDHKSDDSAVDNADGFTRGPNGSRVPKWTTRGWKLLVRLKDHAVEWFKLKDLKESNPCWRPYRTASVL